MAEQTSNGKNRPPKDSLQPSRTRSGIRNWLLLYRPSRSRAWRYRIAFYLLAFFAVPVLAIAALGAYVGPDKTWEGAPAVLIAVLLSIIVRHRAVRAEATLGKPTAPHDCNRLIAGWPFPLEDPPPRRLIRGYMESAIGTLLILIGFLGGGLAANGVVWPVLLLSGIELDNARTPPVLVTAVLAISAIVMGVLISVFALSAGTRRRDRGRRFRARDARSLFQLPGEQPVLLLRSFDDDELVDPRPVTFLQRRYEENLSRALGQLGPVIAVGRPGDSLGFAGAARFYVSQDNWQAAIRYLMGHTAAVVLIVGRTEGLWWEIDTALECVSRERLLFLFPAVDQWPEIHSRYADFKRFLKRWNLFGSTYAQMEAERRARYEVFRQRSAKYLGDTLPKDLKNAFFLDFLPGGEVRVLCSRYRFLRNHMLDVVPRFRRLRFDMARTLWPFIAKLYDTTARI
jgi:nitrate reductase NapE component